MLNANGGGVIKNFFKNLVASMKCDCVSDKRFEPQYPKVGEQKI